MNDLAALTGRPKLLRVAGTSYRLYPLRLRDLGRFQGWIDAQTPDPIDSVLEALGGFSGPARRYLALGGPAYAESRRPLFGSPEADEVAHSIGGVAELLYLAIRQGMRGFSRRDAATLYWGLDDRAMVKLRWAVWGTLPRLPRPGDDDGDDPIDWWAMYHKLMNDPYRLTPRAVGQMTMTQVRCLLSDGHAPRPDGRAGRIRSGEEFDAFLKARSLDPWSIP